ncbi:MAG: hypothetical protein AAGF12_03395 [Myxococcota bacterium]
MGGFVGLLSFGALLFPSMGFAHPMVEEGQALMRRAQFRDALEAFNRAETDGDLTREDVIAIYDARCLIYRATRRAELQRAITALGSLEPTHRFPAEAPPELQALFDAEVHTGLFIELDVTPSLETVTVDARVANDVAGLVSEVVRYVDLGDGTFREVQERELRPEGRTVRYFVEAFGPGGAVLASAGSRDAPEIARLHLAPLQSAPDEEEGPSPWIFVGIGAGVAVAAAVLITVLLVVPGEADTQPDFPMVVGF